MNLLDVNLLVALCDADHVHHRAAAQRQGIVRAGAAAEMDACRGPGLSSACAGPDGHPL